jgi:hypothetical protein
MGGKLLLVFYFQAAVKSNTQTYQQPKWNILFVPEVKIPYTQQIYRYKD